MPWPSCTTGCPWSEGPAPTSSSKSRLSRKPGAAMKFEDWVDDSIVRELDKSGFIDKV